MSDTTSSDQSSLTTTTTWRDALRWVAVAALVGAGAIHFAYAPPHFDEATSHGAFFVGVAWAQFAAAFALLRWRDRREPWLGAAVLSLGVIAVWMVSRTTGIPGEGAELVGFADALATSLEGLTVLAAVAAVQPAMAAKPVPRVTGAVGAVAAVAVVGLVSFAANPSVGSSHVHAGTDGADGAAGDGDGHDHGDGGDVEGVELVSRDARCDINFNTPTFNETAPQTEPVPHDDDPDAAHDIDFTLEEFAEVFVDPDNPMADDDLSVDLFLDYVRSDPVREQEVLSGGMTHELAPDPWLPMTDHDECLQLADELERTLAVAERYPTAQDAVDADYWQVTAYLPAIASHYINGSYVGEFDIDNPAMLLYEGDCDVETGEGCDAKIVGISHYILGDEYPDAGFTGPNDHWHRHIGLCMGSANGGPRVIGGTSLTEEQCNERGGSKGGGTDGWMNHVWVVPGCESDWGLFSGANPAMVTRGASSGDPFELDNTDPIPSGCGSGKTLDDPHGFDEGGHGPSLRD